MPNRAYIKIGAKISEYAKIHSDFCKFNLVTIFLNSHNVYGTFRLDAEKINSIHLFRSFSKRIYVLSMYEIRISFFIFQFPSFTRPPKENKI